MPAAVFDELGKFGVSLVIYSGVRFGSNVRFDTERKLYKLDVKGKSRWLSVPAANPGREKLH
jgi:hypothetical protein